MTQVFGFFAILWGLSAVGVAIASFVNPEIAEMFGSGFVSQAIMAALSLWFMQLVLNKLEEIDWSIRKGKDGK